MPGNREVIQTTANFIIAREVNRATHDDPSKRGGYLLMAPGRVPEIVLDGLASAEEQHAAELRCLRELESMVYQAQTMSNADQQRETQRREIVRLKPDLVVTRVIDPEVHRDPRRRGAYLHRVPGQVPEIVLDGLASEHEQREGEQRCLRELDAHGSADRLQGLLRGRHSSGSSAPPPSARTRPPAGGSNPPQPLKPSQKSAVLLGQRLLLRGIISEKVLERALDQQLSLPPERRVRRLGSLLVEAGALSMPQAAAALGEQRGVQAATSAAVRVDPPLRQIFPVEDLDRLAAAPLFRLGSTLVVAMCDPQVTETVAALQALTQHPIHPVQASQIQVYRLIDSIRKRAA